MAAVLKNSILLGQVLPSTLKSAVKVQVPYFVFNENLKGYFKQTEDFIAKDTTKCKVGDLVLIQKLTKQDKKEKGAVVRRVAQFVIQERFYKD